jgi:hypothetical protein
MGKKVICFDLDGVISNNTWGNYKLAKPIKKNIKFINILSKKYKVIIFTSRYMGRNNDNSRKANKQGYKLTFSQLKKWKVNFDKLILGKPSYDLIVDDKAIFFKKNWINQLKKQISKFDN